MLVLTDKIHFKNNHLKKLRRSIKSLKRVEIAFVRRTWIDAKNSTTELYNSNITLL